MAALFSLKCGTRRLFNICNTCTTRLHAPVLKRQIQNTACMMSFSDAEFTAAKDRLNSLKEDPGNEVKLQIYALFKQATAGTCNTPKPGAFDFVGKAKWSSWNSLGNMSQDQAKEKYVGIVDDLVAQEGGEAETASTTQGSLSFTGLKYTVDNGVATITLNRPNKKNAVTTEMYSEWTAALKMAGEDDRVVLAVITGAGDYYCSGNDLNNFMKIDPSVLHEESVKGSDLLEIFVNGFIDFPKPLICAVNGPAVGISVTTLGLMDVIYASDKATFHTPFAALGQSPEGCSSYTFPKIMGTAQANECLLFGKKLTAQEAFDRGLVTEVIPDAQFRETVDKKVKEYAQLPRNALRLAKNLIRETEKERLHKVNRAECDLLVDRWTSDECTQAIMNYFSKSKL
ncbi:enoyl-CoA delta isomerase 2, mitochondrial [Strongylocentrotus purpuratus]|uniref:ACB domain-containing protein n=1 Tax=Strongylocentrotus purpuratus TaxID=7668 RepID=A0A7M7RBM3_STRPU|nr:enoyl-CoA delta isomerase 2, mitochondrial [Strongylocentrotus purpuratus]|eukprot:XP_780031.1 PREDICTED: enoyl-CoA delta isomerase 2, mitochondrial [Strongylocentrotus purpuratus]